MLEGHEVGEELEGHYFGYGQKILGGGLDVDAVADQRGNLGVAVIGEGDDAGALGLHVGEELEGLLVAHDGVGQGAIDGGDNDEGDSVAD